MKTIPNSIEPRNPETSFGPVLDDAGCLFRIWARPDARIELILESAAASRAIPMQLTPSGMYEAFVEGVRSGTRYRFKIDGAGPYPDPASRYLPEGVHGPSEVIGPSLFCWDGDDFKIPPLRNFVIYELHVGTFTPAGTFLAIIDKLDYLQQLGINVIELMPIADFAGNHNWGYDGVALYAPSHHYGAPDDLRSLVREAHGRGIAVCLDVVYNHLGPDGAYHSTFAPRFYSGKHKTPWGDGLNFDGDSREKVRGYFIESALMWINEYHVDGLRADATHAILDDSKPNFLAELTQRVHAAARERGREVFIIAEDERNERRLLLPPEKGGQGFDAVWSDDFHHHLRHRLAGDSDGYFRDFDGRASSIARTVEQGWFFCGPSPDQLAQRPQTHVRGTSPEGLSWESRLFCIQNHDQIGNRALGERLSTQISAAAYSAASTLLLLSPEIPLLFMGQEWAAPEPFLYFTNHNAELGRLVTEGRRKEFEHFSAFSDEVHSLKIPDPQAEQTFLQSKLDWNIRQAPNHQACLNWYRTLLHIRQRLLQKAHFTSATALDDNIILIEWKSLAGRLIAAIALEGPTTGRIFAAKEEEIILSSETGRYASYGNQIATVVKNRDELTFQQAGAVLLASGDLLSVAGNEQHDR